MGSKMTKLNEYMLMDVDALDFAVDGVSESEEELPCGIDKVSNAPVYPFSNSSNVPKEKNLHFVFGPIVSKSVAFNKERGINELFPMHIPYFENSIEYTQYVSKLFEIYKSLGQDRQFNIPAIGLIKHSYTLEHNQTVNLAVEAMVSELEFFIESLKFSHRHQRLIDLEECLTILNCLKTIQFTLDSEEADSRMKMINSLINWVNRCDGEPSDSVIAAILDSDSKTPTRDNIFYWKVLCQLILRGLFEQAVATIKKAELLSYLENICPTTYTMVQDMINLLQSYPRESDSMFREWKELVLNLYNDWTQSVLEIPSSLKSSLEDVLLLMSGNKTKILYYSKTWYESYCGLMLYYIPSLQLSEEYLQLAIKEHPLDVTNSWEQACADIIMGKIYSILPILDSLDNCTAAFTASICEAKGLLDNDLIEDGIFDYGNIEHDIFGAKTTMSGYLLNQFALSIVTSGDKNMWYVAIGIISLTPNFSDTAKRMTIAELLPHYPFQTNDDTEWMLTICAKWKLPHISRTVYRILGQEALYLNNVIEAMSNFSKAGEFEWVKHYSWMIFEASILQGSPLEDEVVNAIIMSNEHSEIPKELVDAMVTPAMKQSLSPYAVLFEFYIAIDGKRWDEALELLLSLIEFQYLPQKYLVLLLGRFLFPIYLQDDDKVMREQEVLRVIKALDKLGDVPNEVSCAMYRELLTKSDDLPNEISSLLVAIRTKLSLKLCREFM
ncbi:HDL144Cp [Eremothecium sinecaudum]|uniref:Nuclear pore complex protein Nup85 n=1 Tax=Eremothecium sinecaudum TaxID=45286 RepID=A0A0X8HSG1_9SACH|nr:HDL144Cp [Eremothecium sinecaudum]AMD20600.1 HDL144Cp [Eremothecium sinecaudum]